MSSASTTSLVSITFTSTHAVVLLESLAISFQLFAVGMWAVPLRWKLFPRSFFVSNFPEWVERGDHDPVYRALIHEGGYPDSGQGRIADRLSDDDWLEFNSHQRAHANTLEFAVPVLTSLIGASVAYPRPAAQLGLVYLIGRQLYIMGYKKKGSSGRLIGAVIGELALFGLYGLAASGLWKFSGGLGGILSILPGMGKK
jgi:hypothetical protein